MIANGPTPPTVNRTVDLNIGLYRTQEHKNTRTQEHETGIARRRRTERIPELAKNYTGEKKLCQDYTKN